MNALRRLPIVFLTLALVSYSSRAGGYAGAQDDGRAGAYAGAQADGRSGAYTGADTISVRLFASARPDAVIFSPVAGKYILAISGAPDLIIQPGEPVLIYRSEGGIIVKTRFEIGLRTDSLSLYSPSGGQFVLSPAGSATEKRIYNDRLTCWYNSGIFLLLNETTLEKYLPGVVRTEGGAGKHPEFYKAQAVIARTFAGRYMEKHLSDGYNMCDDIHCQAYHGVTNDTAIIAAVRATENVVITDKDSVLIMAAFHSNCGGETAPASEAWVADLPYLQKNSDPYCTSSPNAKWQKSVPVSDWQAFLVHSGYSGDLSVANLNNFSQPGTRKQYFDPVPGFRVAVTAIRAEFGLRSSFFSLSQAGDKITFSGRGYGHGVGLCQEGAMVMAAQGKSYSEIIAFYYRNVILMNSVSAKPFTIVN
jgi:stage II sporulation protein D